MLRIAEGVPSGQVTFRESSKAKARREKEEARQARMNLLATPKASAGTLRQLPWPLFLAELRRRRDQVTRAHVRWCMRSAIRTCETLKRAEGRAFELRPGGRHNIVSGGGLYHESYRDDYRGVPERIGSGSDGLLMYRHSRYLHELEDNLRRLLCPEWAIPVIGRAIRAKLASGWELDFDLEGGEAS